MVITADHPEQSDAQELVSRARRGDARAFCLLVEPLQARLLRQAVALAGDLSAAEDLVSETLVEAWKNLPRYNESCRFSTWLYAILLHRYQKSIRHARSRPVPLARLSVFEAGEARSRYQDTPATEPLPSEIAAQKEIFNQLRRCLEFLPEKHREVLLLRFFEGASVPEIATVLNCSVGTVKSRLHHALDKLRKMKMNLLPPGGDTHI